MKMQSEPNTVEVPEEQIPSPEQQERIKAFLRQLEKKSLVKAQRRIHALKKQRRVRVRNKIARASRKANRV
jgi:hypothetical protein